MKYSLIIKPEAEYDILESAKWYEEKQQNLGVRFLDEVEEKLDSVIQNPLHYQVRYRSTRLALVDHFPYAIHYIVVVLFYFSFIPATSNSYKVGCIGGFIIKKKVI